MAKITVLEAKTFQGKPSGFRVTLDNGTTGNLQEKESDKGLRIGDEVDVTLIPYTSKAGVTSNLIGLKFAQAGTSQNTSVFKPTGGQTPSFQPPITPHSKGLVELKANATVKAMEFVIDAFLQDKITWDKIKEYHKEITGYLYNAIDECSS
jgi:hypothetical protein